jgi:radical SAM-linked protein
MERMVPYRVRIRFRKQGDLRLISHRDLARTLERLFRRAGIALRMSEGFHPKPRMSFPSALGLGIAGLDEVMEVDLQEELPPPQLLAALAAQAPAGLSFQTADTVPAGARKAQLRSLTYEVPVPPHRRADLPAAVNRLLAAESWPITRTGRDMPVDVRPLIEDLQIGEDWLRMQLQATHEAGARPRDVLAALGWDDDLESAVWSLARTAVELQP